MKKLLPLAVLTASFSAQSFAAGPTLYGKANVSLQSADEGEAVTELVSNASRIGVKGSLALENTGLEAFYKFEYETFVDDGENSGDTLEVDGDEVDINKKTFSQRNILVGVRGNFGALQAGNFDTPLKKAQKKIDLFNDLEGDIKSFVTVNDNRKSNSVQYSTPGSLGAFSVAVALVASEEDDVSDGFSASLAFEQDGLYLALATDSDVEDDGVDVIRAVAQYKIGDFQLGALYEDVDIDTDVFEGSADGWVVSAKYTTDQWALKAQLGQSDIVEDDGDTYSLGVDYKLSKKFKTFAYYTVEEAGDAIDNNYFGLGAELKF